MSIWEEQQKILNENLAEENTRKYINRHVLEAIKHREANMEPKLHKFVTVITVTSDIEYIGETAEDAALAAQQWLEYGLNTAHTWYDEGQAIGIQFNFHTYQVSETPMPEDLAEEYGSETYMWPPLETSKVYSV